MLKTFEALGALRREGCGREMGMVIAARETHRCWCIARFRDGLFTGELGVRPQTANPFMGAPKGAHWGNVSELCGRLLRQGEFGLLWVGAVKTAIFTPLGTE